MDASKLDRPITLQRAVETFNDINEPVMTWATFGKARIMANRTYKNATETLGAGQQVQATLLSRYIIRWARDIADLNPKDRFADHIDGRLYEITGVYELGRQKWFEIHSVAMAD